MKILWFDKADNLMVVYKRETDAWVFYGKMQSRFHVSRDEQFLKSNEQDL